MIIKIIYRIVKLRRQLQRAQTSRTTMRVAARNPPRVVRRQYQARVRVRVEVDVTLMKSWTRPRRLNH